MDAPHAFDLTQVWQWREGSKCARKLAKSVAENAQRPVA